MRALFHDISLIEIFLSWEYHIYTAGRAVSNFPHEKFLVCGKTRSQAQLSDDPIHWERYYIKTVVCSDCFFATTKADSDALSSLKADMTKRFRELYNAGPGAVNTDGLPKPSEDFINQIDSVLNKRGGNATSSERAPGKFDKPTPVHELPQTADDFVQFVQWGRKLNRP